MSANQLISKALSTTSEDEAVACLKMARKKGLKIEAADPNSVSLQDAQLLAQGIGQARAERDRYKRGWQERGYENKVLQVKLDNALFKQIMSIVVTAFLSSVFWLLFVIM